MNADTTAIVTDDEAHVGAGSRWYHHVFSGLWEAKHVQAMGQAIWLYGWMLSRAHVAHAQRDSQGVITYSHLDAAADLGATDRTIRRWFSTLQEHGYVEIRARDSYHLEVAITNWRTIEQWLSTRDSADGLTRADTRPDKSVRSGDEAAGRADKSVRSDEPRADRNVRSADRADTRADMRADNSVRSPLLAIRLRNYEYPTGPGAERRDQHPELVSLADAFHDLKARLVTTTNKPAILREIYRLCFGGRDEDLPSYGYIGKVANQVGGKNGEGRLAELMWQATVRPPTGDPLSYILNTVKAIRANGKGGGRGKAESREMPSDDVWANQAFEEYDAKQKPTE